MGQEQQQFLKLIYTQLRGELRLSAPDVTAAIDAAQSIDEVEALLAQINLSLDQVVTLLEFGTNRQYSDWVPASAPLSALRVVTISNGELVYADSSNVSHAHSVLGLLLQATSTGQQIRVLTDGPVMDAAWNWSLLSPIWLGNSGNLVQTPPNSGFQLQVATAVMPISLEFKIQEPIIL
jgi:hypothetical protein